MKQFFKEKFTQFFLKNFTFQTKHFFFKKKLNEISKYISFKTFKSKSFNSQIKDLLLSIF